MYATYTHSSLKTEIHIVLSDAGNNDATGRTTVHRHPSPGEGQKNNDIDVRGAPGRRRRHAGQGRRPPKPDEHRESTRETDPLPVDRDEDPARIGLHSFYMVSAMEEAFFQGHAYRAGPGLCR